MECKTPSSNFFPLRKIVFLGERFLLIFDHFTLLCTYFLIEGVLFLQASDYSQETEIMKNMTKQEFVAFIRR